MNTINITSLRAAIAAQLKKVRLVHQIGDETKKQCTFSAMQMALTGTLTDDRPQCVSQLIYDFWIPFQDHLPLNILNSREIRNLIPLIAGTGNDPADEERRQQTLRSWLYEVVLPLFQEEADRAGMGDEWKEMIRLQTHQAIIETKSAAIRRGSSLLQEVTGNLLHGWGLHNWACVAYLANQWDKMEAAKLLRCLVRTDGPVSCEI